MAVNMAPDAVLLETKRSDGQGMAALRRLRAECPGLSIVVLTSYPQADEQKEALRAGAVRYLLKDIGSAYLVQELRALVHPHAAI